MKPILTTGDVARHCHVSIPTVYGWIRQGHLDAYTLPNGHHRILLDEFLAFLERHEMPIPEALSPDNGAERRILIVHDVPQVVRALTRALTRDGPEWKIASAHHGFEAGMLVASFEPHLVILDLTTPDGDGSWACQLIRSNPDTAHIRIFALTGPVQPEHTEQLPALGVDDFMESPLDLDEFLARVKRLLATRSKCDQDRQVE